MTAEALPNPILNSPYEAPEGRFCPRPERSHRRDARRIDEAFPKKDHIAAHSDRPSPRLAEVTQ